MDIKTPQLKHCFVIMPISDVDGYDAGHFKRVYNYIIKPACLGAGFSPIRADDVQATNYIVIDILKNIINAEMVICDLSSRNPNVLYELGIRQAFNLPVTLIKDSRTSRIFDIQGLRDIEYDETLRIDSVESAKALLESTLRNTSNLPQGDINSIIQLLGVQPANLPSVEISEDTSLVLNAIKGLAERLSRLEELQDRGERPVERKIRERAFRDKNGKVIRPGASIRHPDLGEGKIVMLTNEYILIDFPDGGYALEPENARILEVISIPTPGSGT